jgi:hypothetical protein
MAPKKPSAEQPRKPNKFRLVVFEGDFSDGSISQIAQALTSALRPSATTAPRQLHSGKSTGQILPPDLDDEVDEEEDQQIDVEDEADEPRVDAEKISKPSRQKKTKPPVYLHDLIADADAAKSFATEKAPSSKTKQYLTAMFWLKELNSNPTANNDKVYTFYKTVGWSTNFNDWGQTFHNLLSGDLIRKGEAKGEYTINPTGEAVVKSLPE